MAMIMPDILILSDIIYNFDKPAGSHNSYYVFLLC